MRPLYILVFLSPLIALYELGSAYYLAGGASGAAQTIRAHRLLEVFFGVFGVGSIYLPGIALIVVLLVWHVLRRDRWEVRLPVLAGMLLESIAWCVPVLVVGQMVGRALRGMAAPAAAALDRVVVTGAPTLAAQSADKLAELSRPALATIAVGAGLYEELLFRMVAIAGVHFVAADLLQVKEPWAKTAAVILPALAFAAHHDVWGAGGPDWARLGFFFIAGLYFGVLYLFRGFGIVVAVHALYDLTVLLGRPGS